MVVQMLFLLTKQVRAYGKKNCPFLFKRKDFFFKGKDLFKMLGICIRCV